MFVDVSDYFMCWFGNQLSVRFRHQNDDLLPRWPSSRHIQFGLLLALAAVLDFQNFIDFIGWQRRKASFTQRMSLTFKVLDLEACTYDFFMLKGLGTFWGTTDSWGGGAGTGFGRGGGTAVFDGREVEGIIVQECGQTLGRVRVSGQE